MRRAARSSALIVAGVGAAALLACPTASVDSPAGAAPVDGVCPTPCGGGDCTCGNGCSCAFEQVNGATIICSQESSCHAAGTGTIFFMCLDRSSCDLTCEEGATCYLDCMSGAHCKMGCQGTSSCWVRTCEVDAGHCDSGVRVCNRACP